MAVHLVGHIPAALMPQPRPDAADPGQLSLALWSPMTVVPQGDGSYLVKAGKPQEWLTVDQFARTVGLHRNTIYPRIGSADLPEQYIQYTGPRRIRISAAAVAHWQARWRIQRGLGA